MKKYKPKNISLEAFQFNNDNSSYDLLHWVNTHQFKLDRQFVQWTNGNLFVITLFGMKIAHKGDWVIILPDNDLEVCTNDAFLEKYDLIIDERVTSNTVNP